MLEAAASSKTKSEHEEELLVWKTRRRKSPKNIHRQNGRQKSIFTPAESDQFQIGTRTWCVAADLTMGERCGRAIAHDRSLHLRKAINRCRMDIKGSRDIGDRFAFYDKPSSQLFLIHAKFSRTTESDSSFSGGVSPRTCSLSYQISLKFRYTGENSHNHFASVRCCIGPGFRE
jgi:hypothetical protein